MGAGWSREENSRVVQENVYDSLAGAYGVVALVALVQLARIQLRVPEYGWTTQKVFHLLNFLCAGLRCGVFAFRRRVENLRPEVWCYVLLDLPGLLFFTTYTLLVLFWAEIYHQARSLPTGALRPTFLAVNLAVYAVQVGFWVYSGAANDGAVTLGPVAEITAVFLAVVNFAAALGFLVYGGRLFVMLRRFPIESKGRRKKLREVGAVTFVCAACFATRAIFVTFYAFSADKASEVALDAINRPLLNLIYYTLVELVPAALVLYILRKLPPKRAATYEPLDSQADARFTARA